MRRIRVSLTLASIATLVVACTPTPTEVPGTWAPEPPARVLTVPGDSSSAPITTQNTEVEPPAKADTTGSGRGGTFGGGGN